MADPNSLNVTVDVVFPTAIVLAMLVINGFIFAFIMKKRRAYQNLKAVKEQQRTSYAATGSQVVAAPQAETEDDCAIEMERL
ncbi:uncharacterized protein [Drosophila bipectinata]|uniref:uncharacterized protein n=1 Tax=Drosophila bipectinata TaxID=42026 RepID=UPI0007E7E748|nr:uncharacterized protein LOC108131992 [Drosophila bipectinata]